MIHFHKLSKFAITFLLAKPPHYSRCIIATFASILKSPIPKRSAEKRETLGSKNRAHKIAQRPSPSREFPRGGNLENRFPGMFWLCVRDLDGRASRRHKEGPNHIDNIGACAFASRWHSSICPRYFTTDKIPVMIEENASEYPIIEFALDNRCATAHPCTPQPSPLEIKCSAINNSASTKFITLERSRDVNRVYYAIDEFLWDIPLSRATTSFIILISWALMHSEEIAYVSSSEDLRLRNELEYYGMWMWLRWVLWLETWKYRFSGQFFDRGIANFWVTEVANQIFHVKLQVIITQIIFLDIKK